MPRLPKVNFVSHASLNRLGWNPASVTNVFGGIRGLLLRGGDSIRGCASTDSPTDAIPQESRRDIRKPKHRLYGCEDRRHCRKRRHFFHAINGVGRRKVPRAAVASLRMTSDRDIVKLSHYGGERSFEKFRRLTAVATAVYRCSAASATPCRTKYFHLSIPAGTATSKNPTIISSEVWSPHLTVFSGSGLCGLFRELSYQATARSLVPAFNSRGSASL